MKLFSKILTQVVLSFGLLASFGVTQASATVINFTNVEAPGVTCCGLVNSNAWSSYGVTVTNAYWYSDNRDTFDGQGLSVRNAPTATISFAAPVTNLSLQAWVIGGYVGTYNVFDAANNLIDTLVVNAPTVDINTTYSFVGGPIARLEWTSTAGFGQVSGIRFDAVPEPGSFALILVALGMLAFAARRRTTDAV